MSLWLRAIVVLAALKSFVGCLGLIARLDPASLDWQRDLLRLGSIALFSGAAVLLLGAGRRDRRAGYLGAVFLMAASSFASAGFEVENAAGSPHRLLDLLAHLDPDAFIPLVFWLFVREFPRTTGPRIGDRVTSSAIRLSALVGVGLFALVASASVHSDAWHDVVMGPAVTRIFWGALAALCLWALGYALAGLKSASRSERHRVRLFLFGLLIGIAPMFLALLLAAFWPRLDAVLIDPHDPWHVRLILRLLLLMVPVTTAYTVLRQHALDVKLVIRQAIRYALARYTVIAATAVPFALALAHLYRHRAEPLAELFSGNRLAILFGLTLLGLFLLRWQKDLLHRIDQRFFREQYDSERMLIELVEKGRSISRPTEMVTLLESQLDRALHPETVAVLLKIPEEGALRSPDRTTQDLSGASLLVKMLEASSESMEVDLENPRSPMNHLPPEDENFLAEGAYRLLTPLIDSQGRLAGLIALGDKRSELGFSDEDRRLLSRAATVAALALEGLDSSGAGHELSGLIQQDEQRLRARECPTCLTVYPPSEERCPGCGGLLIHAPLPIHPLGKYELVRRVGQGGMGTVYLARDSDLRRDVAIKTLPRLSADRSMRLRREARAMAAITHPNVALIYAIEVWQGVPMLIMEYLPKGTLIDHQLELLHQPDEVLHLGVVLCDVLDRAHSLGFLHRDIKPSNVGYSRDGEPKLLDFGLAKILADLHSVGVPTANLSETTLTLPMATRSEGRDDTKVVGTPAYMAPEAILGKPPRPSFDLWSLGVLMVEVLTGQSPFRGATPEETLNLVLEARPPDLRNLWPDCPLNFARTLETCLAKDPHARPPTARAFRKTLEQLPVTAAESA